MFLFSRSSCIRLEWAATHVMGEVLVQ